MPHQALEFASPQLPCLHKSFAVPMVQRAQLQTVVRLVADWVELAMSLVDVLLTGDEVEGPPEGVPWLVRQQI